MMVIFLTGLVAMILMRTLHKDIARYTRDDADLEEVRCLFCFFLNFFFKSV